MERERTPKEQVQKELGRFIEKKMFEQEDLLIRKGTIKRGMSRSQLAELVGVSRVWMSDIINGNRQPTNHLLMKIANALCIDEHELFKVARRIHPEVLEGYKREYLGEYYIKGLDD